MLKMIQPGYYVSTFGNVYSSKRGKVKKLAAIDSHGYQRVCLWENAKGKKHQIHRLVAEAFIGSAPSAIHQINHIDGVKKNNHVSNLEWVTPKENIKHGEGLGLMTQHGSGHPLHKLEKDEVLQIYYLLDNTTISQTEVAKLYGVSQGLIWGIKNGKNWRLLYNEQRNIL
jgi:hypothetical protein